MRTVKKIVSALAVPILYFKISILEVFKFTPVIQSKKLKAGSMHQPSCSFITDGEDVFGTYSTFYLRQQVYILQFSVAENFVEFFSRRNSNLLLTSFNKLA